MTLEEQKSYRSGTGKLLYLVKYTCPDIANAVRELLKVLDAITPRAMKELSRVIKYVIDIENMELRIEPKLTTKDNMWELIILQ